MTTEREAKCWMLAAGAVVVWACTMVGCAGSPISTTAKPVNRPTTASITPTRHAATSMTVSRDTLAAGSWAAASVVPASSTLGSTDLIGAAVDRPSAAGGWFGVEFDGFSLARPLMSAKRLLSAAVAMLPPITVSQGFDATSSVLPMDFAARPLAGSSTLAQRWAASADEVVIPAIAFGGGGLAGVALVDWSAMRAGPWQTDPTPTPTMGAVMSADVAKFDAAGSVGMVLGSMVLLFGGEAVVMFVLNRKRQAEREISSVTDEPLEEDASIFRFPEPVVLTQGRASFSRAA